MLEEMADFVNISLRALCGGRVNFLFTDPSERARNILMATERSRFQLPSQGDLRDARPHAMRLRLDFPLTDWCAIWCT